MINIIQTRIRLKGLDQVGKDEGNVDDVPIAVVEVNSREELQAAVEEDTRRAINRRLGTTVEGSVIRKKETKTEAP